MRTSLGTAAACVRPNDMLGDVALCARACTVVQNGLCVGDVVCPVATWPCERGKGTTKFEVTAGRKELWIDVSCPDGTPAAVQVPEPVVRDIVDGEVTQLNAVLITVPADTGACPQ